MTTPIVSVVMAAYNAQEFLNIAIDSILNQTYKNFELIIVDDGSTDQSKSIINHYRDSRIKYFYQKNQGLAVALNNGIKNSIGKYIARMDADDISYPTRFEKQVGFLEKNPSHVLVGTCFDIIDLNGCVFNRSWHLIKNEDLKLEFLVRNPFGHGTIMASREAVLKAGGYDEAQPIEDYEMWWRLSKEGSIHNIPERLYGWRVNPEGISHGGSDKRQPLISKLMESIWNENVQSLPRFVQISNQIKFYSGFTEAKQFVEQYCFMLSAVGLSLIRKGRLIDGTRLLINLVASFPSSLKYILELRERPTSHNYNLRNIS